MLLEAFQVHASRKTCDVRPMDLPERENEQLDTYCMAAKPSPREITKPTWVRLR